MEQLEQQWKHPDLSGRVAVVTGSSRGAGRAVAMVLGECGATVYVTGRSIAGSPTSDGMPGAIEQSAADVTARGGKGIAVRCDHTDASDVEALFRQVDREEGALDILVNNVWGGYEGHEGAAFTAPLWEQPLRHWDGMFVAGVRAHLIASSLAIPLMLRNNTGLIVNTTAWDQGKYLGNAYYDVAKAAVNRMAFALSRDLKGTGITALAVAPGFMRTERVMAAHAEHPFDLSGTETPEYLGRAIASLAADPNVGSKGGITIAAGTLAAEYGFTDIDGRRVPPFVIPEL